MPLAANEQPERALDRSEAHAAVIIPEGFERDLRRGTGAEVQWLLDGADANTATNMRNHANTITQAFNRQVGAGAPRPAVVARTRFWFNPGNDEDQFVGPGIFAVGLALFPPLLAALAVSREGEQKTILQVYVSSISAHEYLLGKILAFMIIAAAEWALTLALALVNFGLWFKGDPTPFLVSSFLFLFCSVAFGAMIGARIPDRAAAIQAIQNTGFLLSYLLSGFIFPVAEHPGLRALGVVPDSGALLHRGDARRLRARRRLAGRVVRAGRADGSEHRLLRVGVGADAPHAGGGLR